MKTRKTDSRIDGWLQKILEAFTKKISQGIRGDRLGT
jgi:hypothetical protein